MENLNNDKEVFMNDEDLQLREEFISFSALNPFISTISTSRSIMMHSFLSQTITIENGDSKIVQSGLETQFGKNTFSKKFEHDVLILSVIKRYNGVGVNQVNADVGFTIIYEDLHTGEVDFLEVPKYFKLHQYFGFKYKLDEGVAATLQPGSMIPADTVVADAPNVGKNSTLKYGINANIAYLSIPEITEDGVVISKSMAKKLSYKIYETRTVEFGEKSFPLNIYGDENNYKPFPDIGEKINEDSVLIAIRDYNTLLTPSLTSVNDVMEFNPMFDKTYYVKSPNSELIDAKIYYNKKFKKEMYTGTNPGIDKYVNSYKKYYTDIIAMYETLQREHYKKHNDNNFKISERMQRLIHNAYVMINKDNSKIKFTYKKKNLDIYRAEFIIETTITPDVGSKVATLSGSKGIVIEVRDDDKMPMNPITGEVADIIIDDASVANRMNLGNLYEQYFSGMSRTVQRLVNSELSKLNKTPIELSDEETNRIFNLPLELLKIVDTEQYTGYLNATTNQKRTIIKEIIEEEFYIYYKVSSKKKEYEIVAEVNKTIFKPATGKVTWESQGNKFTSETDVMLAPQYIILLAKTADNFLSSASPHLNHYGVATSVSSAHRDLSPFRNASVKALGETESRLYGAYGKDKNLLAELKDRGNSIPTHRAMYSALLTAERPTDIDNLVDRNEIPFGNDSAIRLLDNIINPAGFELSFTPDTHTEHPQKKI